MKKNLPFCSGLLCLLLAFASTSFAQVPTQENCPETSSAAKEMTIFIKEIEEIEHRTYLTYTEEPKVEDQTIFLHSAYSEGFKNALGNTVTVVYRDIQLFNLHDEICTQEIEFESLDEKPFPAKN